MTKTYAGEPVAPDHSLGGIYAIMDRHGMLPDEWFCARCAKPLNADGNHPAELYAGTYNGLCYGCTSAPAFVAAVTALDGARKVSWPPGCPSYRRDREDHIGYPDCANCQGLGATGYTSSAKSCDACLGRYSSHPQRAGWRWWSERIMRSCQAAFERAWDYYAGVPRKCSKKRQAELRAAFSGPDREHATPEFTQLKADYMAGYRRIRELVDGCFARDEWVPVTGDPQAFWRQYCAWRQLDPDTGLGYGYPQGFRYAHQPKPMCREHRHFDGCDECTARIIGAQSLQTVEDWYRLGHISSRWLDAYRHLWATSAHRYSSIPWGWEAEPEDSKTVEAVALMRRAAEERKAAS